MNVLLWIIFGGIAGWLASVLTGTGHSIIWDVVVGIIGALLGGWIGGAITGQTGTAGTRRPSTAGGFFWAVIGAIVLILILRLLGLA